MKRRSPVQAEPRREIYLGLVATATAATITTAATRALFAWFSDVHREGAAMQFPAIQGFDGFLRFIARTHGHKTKAAGAIGHAIHHQVSFGDRAMRGERVLQVVFGGIEGKISDKQFITHVMFYCPTNRDFPQTVPERRV